MLQTNYKLVKKKEHYHKIADTADCIFTYKNYLRLLFKNYLKYLKGDYD